MQEVRDLLLSNYFVNLIKTFYENNERFHLLIDQGADILGGTNNVKYSIGSVNCHVSAGCSRACFNFSSSDPNDLLNYYVIKAATDWNDRWYRPLHDRQNKIEYSTYCVEQNTQLGEFLPEIIQGPLISEVFPTADSGDARFYFAEKASMDFDKYWDLAYKYLLNNVDILVNGHFLSPDEVDNKERISNAAYECVDYIDNTERFLQICELLDYSLDEETIQKINNIGDLHEENIGFIGNRLVIVDYGFSSPDKSIQYEG